MIVVSQGVWLAPAEIVMGKGGSLATEKEEEVFGIPNIHVKLNI